MDRRSIARALTAIESGAATARELLRGHQVPARPAHRIGITHRDTVTHQVKQHPTHRTIKHRNLPNQWMLQ